MDPAALLRVLAHSSMRTLSLNDVGAGFANMRTICELQPHFIKVDRFFIDGLAECLVKWTIVRNIVSFGSDTGAKVVAEGWSGATMRRTSCNWGSI
jgi:EAL domain-containing protein (putative c-di-GMP-specific phosphodiesterase class I)